jgi:fructose-1,6-bisphosphatase I
LGVNGFTLDTSIGEFCLSHREMKLPETGKIYAINQGNSMKFGEKVRQFLDYCMEDNKEEGRPFTHRYIGTMVADIHRTLIKGGLFMYPLDITNNKPKLRLLYECNPMSYVIEMAGGKSTTGDDESVLDVQPTDLHQRVPIFIGNENLIQKVKEYLKG